jgi:hypothetical protein
MRVNRNFKFSFDENIVNIYLKQSIIVFILSCFVFFWYLFLNKYLCIFYQEQTQMFRFSSEYLMQYIQRPGGIAAYLASFLVQFFYYPFAGACVYLFIFLLFYGVFRRVLDKFSVFGKSGSIAYIPGLLFLAASADLRFDIVTGPAAIIALAGFPLLVRVIRNRYYYLLVPVTIVVLYILTGGNFLLCIFFLLLYYFIKRPENYLRYVSVIALSAFIPLLFRRFLYMIPVEDVYTVTTYFYHHPFRLTDFRTISRLSVFIIPLAGMLFRKTAFNSKYVFIFDISLCITFLIVILKQYSPNSENIIRMGYDVENQQWDRVLETSGKMNVGPFNCFYTNLALQRTGQMADRMFHYEQIGTSGLILELEDNLSCRAKSDFFYQLGLINEAQRYAYESMVGYSSYKEPDIRNIKRLLDCSIIRKDTRLSEKYENILGKTLFYENYIVERKPELMHYCAVEMGNIFAQDLPTILTSILESNPAHQFAFEYLMAYYLLERDYENAKKCFDSYFYHFSYSGIPVHYSEFLVLYRRLKGLDENFYKQYPVSVDIREHFDMIDVLISTEIDEQIRKILEERYKNTYWFYVRFPLVDIRKVSKDEKNIY